MAFLRRHECCFTLGTTPLTRSRSLKRLRTSERRSLRLRLSFAIAILLLGVAAGLLIGLVALPGGTIKSVAVKPRAAAAGRPATTREPRARSRAVATGTPRRPLLDRTPVTIGETELQFLDPARTMLIEGRQEPRRFDTIVRYPVGVPGPFPLIVFGHGFAVSPAPYRRLLDAWTRAGYVVAAPIFPLENVNAPGGPDERDLVNQPADMSLVISSLMSPPNPQSAAIGRMINFGDIAVAGQSDGGDTALAAAYDQSVRDPRIKAAVILSGAEDPFAPPFAMPSNGPPLLATQGTADTINPPYQTYAFFNQAAPPKYLLKLIGASHQPPYTVPGLELTEVTRITIAFLNRYLKNRPTALERYVTAGSVGPGSVLISQH
jgi:dienelactone hydrolase